MSTPLRPPPALLVEPLLRLALAEDLGRAGDLTSDLILPPGQIGKAALVARRAGVISGLPFAQQTFLLIDPSLRATQKVEDGSIVAPSTPLLELEGPARSLLTGERVALNIVGHLSGIATMTRTLVDAVAGTKARIVCTRKTTPGLRILEKYAVRCGGGFNHRFGLDDAILIKDNHIAAAGSLTTAVERARAGIGHMLKIEVEVDTLAQLEEALSLGVDTIMLDNMAPPMLSDAVKLTAGRAVLEASGNVTLASVRAIAETGVDYISSGALTHSAPNLDVALDF